MKRSKKIFLLTLATCALTFSLCACGGNSGNNADTPEATETTEYFADNDFMTDLSKSLERRWNDTADENTIGLSDSEYKSMLDSVTQAEIDALSKYQSEKFENSLLQENVIAYLNNLKEHQAALEYYTADYVKFMEDWEAAYDKRVKLIQTFANDFGLTVSEQYQSTLDDILTNAKLVQKEEAADEAIQKWINSFEFEMVSDEYDWKTYQCITENSTGVDFDYVSLSINLIDKDGVVIESTYSSMGNIKNGAKVKFEFMTDADFESYEVTADYYAK